MPPSVGLVLVSSNVSLEPFDGSLSQKSYNNVRIKLSMVNFHCKQVYFSEKKFTLPLPNISQFSFICG